MATGVFGLRKVYIKQNENIDNRNFASWPESATYGYFGGQQNSPNTFENLIQRLEYATQIVSTPATTFPFRIGQMSAVSTNFYGYFAGGVESGPTTGYISSVRRLDFSNETLSDPGNKLPAIRANCGYFQSSSRGYFSGGLFSYGNFSSVSNTIRIEFSSETLSLPGTNLPSAREQIGGVSSNLYGYFGGGYFKSNTFPYPATATSTIARLDFSNETISLPGKNLPAASYNQGSIPSNVFSYGYFAGGNSPTYYYSGILRLDFSTENLTNIGNFSPVSLMDGRSGMASVKSSDAGYFGAGFISPPGGPFMAVISKLDFSNEIISNPGSNLLPGGRAVGVFGANVVSKTSKTYGYMIGGYGTGYVSTVSRLDFSTENISNPGKNLPAVRGNFSGATSSNYYGYFGGGYTPVGTARICTITRLDFSNETLSDPGKNLPTVNSTCGGVSSSNYGYFGGGYSYRFSPPVPALRLCTITRLDFSTESVNNISSRLLGFGIDSMATVMNNSYGYFGGGLTVAPFTSISNITRLDFSNETTSAPPTKLPTNNFELAALSSNSYGYFGGGLFPPGAPGATATNTITRLDFSNDTLSPPGKNLPTAIYRQSTVSSNFYGYFIGGWFPIVNTVSRIDFSNETVSLPGKNNPTIISQSATFSNSN